MAKSGGGTLAKIDIEQFGLALSEHSESNGLGAARLGLSHFTDHPPQRFSQPPERSSHRISHFVQIWRYLILSDTLYQFHSQVLPLSGEKA